MSGEIRKTVLCSGGFDCQTVGHSRLFDEASKYGDVIIALNSDEWLMRKKGYVFMPWEERAEILSRVKGVIDVVRVEDMTDGTVCEAIRRIKPTFFANGGDRTTSNTPEQSVCEELGITMLWGVGGGKVQSSSWLIDAVRKS